MPQRLHSALSTVLIALACLLAPLGALAAWATYEIGDPARYRTVTAPLAADPDVQEAIADAVAAGVMREVHVRPPLQGPVRTFAHDAVRSFAYTEAYRTAWEEANRAAHDAVLRALHSGIQGPVTLDVAPIAQRVKRQLAHDQMPFAHRIPVGHTVVTVLPADDLHRIRKGYRVLEFSSFWLPSLTVVLAVSGILVTACRRCAVLVTGLGTALGGTLLGLAVAAGRHLTLTDLPPHVSRAAAVAVYDALTATLRTVTWVLLTLGAAVALGAWTTARCGRRRQAPRAAGSCSGADVSRSPTQSAAGAAPTARARPRPADPADPTGTPDPPGAEDAMDAADAAGLADTTDATAKAGRA